MLTNHSAPGDTAPGVATPGGATRLDDWGVIRARGADAATFLHGQLTQDVSGLAAGQARLAGYCSAKGRLLATFVIWRPAPDEVLLACSADVLPAVLKRLSMFVLRAKCTLSDATAELPLWGLAGPAAELALPAEAQGAAWTQSVVANATLTRLPDVSVVDGGPAWCRWLCAGLPPVLPELSPATWLALEARSGVARVVAATAEQFVPQMVNFELVGGVNFQKGCYPGQEVVARSQYRGTVKRRAQLFDVDAALLPGQEIFHSSDAEQPAGMVVLAGGDAGAQSALLEVKLAALEEGTLHAGRADGPLLTPRALPYPLPVDGS